MKNLIILVVVVVAAMAAGQWTVQQLPLRQTTSSGPEKSGRLHHVVKVFDGDTIKLDNGIHVRLIGIDTPESHENLKLERDVKKLKKGKGQLLRMGQQASDFTTRLLLGQQVRLEYDVETKDRYQRTLAYVFLADGTFVNEKIICEGYAYPMTYPPNVKYAHLFKQCFDEAREANRGLWRP